MMNSDIYCRTFDFACRILRMERELSRRRTIHRNSVSQLVRSSTSIGANLEEAKAAQSRADFHAKVRISLKEARESHYWLRLLATTDIVSLKRLEPLIQEANEIVAILTTIVKKANPRTP